MSSAPSGISTGIRAFLSPVSVFQPGHLAALSSGGLLMNVLTESKAHSGAIHNDVSPPVPMAQSSVRQAGEGVLIATTRATTISVP